MTSPVQAFDQLREHLAATTADQHQALVDAFVSHYPRSPLVADEEAIIFYTGNAQRVVLRGDMLGEAAVELQRLGDTALWFHRGRYERDARLDYHLLVDGADIGDPRNPDQAPSGYGPRAELRMSSYAAPEWWRERDGVARGSLHAHAAFASMRYPSTRTVWVYTPPNYTPTQRYPSVYFHDGGDYLRFANAATIFDNLISEHVLPPCVAVFVDPSTEHGRVEDYDLNERYVRFFCEELAPFVDAQYSTQREPEHRAVIGASFGGLISLLIANERPDVFALVGSQSGFVSRSDDAVIERYRRVPPLPLRVHLIVGTYETHIGPFERGSSEANFLRSNRDLRAVLQQHGYEHAYAEYHEGHSWGLWRARLGEALCWLLA